MPVNMPLLHGVGVVSGGIIIAFLASILASGDSFFDLRSQSQLNPLLNPLPNQVSGPLNMRPYGFRYSWGFHHDSNDQLWNDDQHPVKLLGCDNLRRHCLACMASIILAIAFTGIALIGHSYAITGSMKCARLSGGIGYGFASVFLIVAVALALKVYDEDWLCGIPGMSYALMGDQGMKVIGHLTQMNLTHHPVPEVTIDMPRHFKLAWGFSLLVSALFIALMMTMSFIACRCASMAGAPEKKQQPEALPSEPAHVDEGEMGQQDPDAQK